MDGTATDQVERFIPACAGNRQLRLSIRRAVGAVHPRVCGEQVTIQSIPACAGNISVCLHAWLSVHPRVCGEQAIQGTAPAAAKVRRFIPACAGNRPSPQAMTFCVYGSSPRVRGTVYIPETCRINGSSPRVRGTGDTIASVFLFHPRVCGEQAWVHGDQPRRFIPACAGNSFAAPGRRLGCGSSPRVRGTGFK